MRTASNDRTATDEDAFQPAAWDESGGLVSRDASQRHVDALVTEIGERNLDSHVVVDRATARVESASTRFRRGLLRRDAQRPARRCVPRSPLGAESRALRVAFDAGGRVRRRPRHRPRRRRRPDAGGCGRRDLPLRRRVAGRVRPCRGVTGRAGRRPGRYKPRREDHLDDSDVSSSTPLSGTSTSPRRRVPTVSPSAASPAARGSGPSGRCARTGRWRPVPPRHWTASARWATGPPTCRSTPFAGIASKPTRRRLRWTAFERRDRRLRRRDDARRGPGRPRRRVVLCGPAEPSRSFGSPPRPATQTVLTRCSRRHGRA